MATVSGTASTTAPAAVSRTMSRSRIARRFLLALALAALALLAGAAPVLTAEPTPGGSISNGDFARDEAGQQLNFVVQIAEDGDPIGIDFRGNLKDGMLYAILVDASGNPVFRSDAEPGSFARRMTLTTLRAGEYRFGIGWDGPVRAEYSLAWRPGGIEAPTITPVAFLGGLGMLAVAVGFVAYAATRRLGWRYLLLGALAWIVTVALKFAWAIPLNPPLYEAAMAGLPAPLATPLFCLYVGALTGIFEVGIAYLALRYTRLGRAPWRSALAFGIGFGAVEALLLSLGPLVLATIALTSPASLPPAQLEALAGQNSLLQALAPVWERFFVVWIHVLSNALIFLAVARRRPSLFWAAFAYKTAIDSFAAYNQIAGVASASGDFATLTWLMEGLIGVFGIVAWMLVSRVRAAYPRPEIEQASAAA